MLNAMLEKVTIEVFATRLMERAPPIEEEEQLENVSEENLTVVEEATLA